MTNAISKDLRPRDYSQGKVYKIQAIGADENEPVYIGSTTKQYLSQRMAKHRSSYRGWLNGKEKKIMSYDIFDKYTINGCEIVLIENVNCNSKDELLRREKYHIQTNNCINKVIPLRTKAEYRLDNTEKIKKYYDDNVENYKNYRINNQDKIAEQKRKYYFNNLNKIAEQKKQYQIVNQDKIVERKKQYYIDKRENILERRKQPYTCDCGTTGRYGDKARHFRTLKHHNYIQSIQPNET